MNHVSIWLSSFSAPPITTCTIVYKMASLRMMPLARHLQVRLPSSWLQARSIATSQTLVPPQASTSTAEADPAAIPSAQDKRTAAASPSAASSPGTSSLQRNLPYYITRTERNQALPVYSNIRSGGTRQEILIRHVSGNLSVSYDRDIVSLPDTSNVLDSRSRIYLGHLLDLTLFRLHRH